MTRNMIIKRQLAVAWVGLALSAGFCAAQTDKATLAVSAIKPLASLSAAMTSAGKGDSLARVVEAYDSQLIDRLNAGRKFEIVGRSDLSEVLREQELADSGNVAAEDPGAATAGQLSGARFVLVGTIDDFEDATERVEFANLNRVGLKRKIRLSTTAKIYDSTSGRLMESVNVRMENSDDRMERENVQRNAEETDVLLLDITRDAAAEIAARVADIVFPIRVLVKRDAQITINRGEGAGVELGQMFNVFAQGERLIDPDTGEVLGQEEVLVGKVRIMSVQPRFSTAEILEDVGITKGAVVRPAGPR